jgi:hypothetical protein
MARSFSFRNRLILVAVALIASAGIANAQGWLPAGAQMLEQEGTILDVGTAGLQMATERNSRWMIQVLPGQSQVRIEGTAETSFLHPGLSIRFSGKLDKKGALQGELKELEIFTPVGKSSRGIFPSGSDDKAKPITKFEEGAYSIRGTLSSYKEGEFTIAAGRKITGKIAKDAKITVRVDDFSLAQKDDTLKMKGFYYGNSRPSPSQGRLGQAIAKEITVTMAKPLVGVQKPTAKTSRANKGKNATENSEASSNIPNVESNDPFGLEKGAKDAK